MTEDEFAFEIESGVERRQIEYKGPGSISDKLLVWRITRAILAMTNRQNGGYVIVGVSETGGVLDPVGIDLAIITEWKQDTLADKVDPLVEPSVDFDLEHRIYKGKYFVLITVREFDETPVFCRFDRQAPGSRDKVLREGALYIRGRRKPETIEIRTAQEMRDLLNVAVTKGIRRYVEQSQAAGIVIGAPPPARNSATMFRAQLADLET